MPLPIPPSPRNAISISIAFFVVCRRVECHQNSVADEHSAPRSDRYPKVTRNAA